MKDQYKILQVFPTTLKVQNLRTGEISDVSKSDVVKSKRKSQGELITEYLIEYPKDPTSKVLSYLGLKNPIYVNKIRKQILIGKR